MDRDGSTQLLVANLIGSKGGALRALPGGDVYIADFEQNRVFVRDSAGQIRTLPTQVENPMKMVRGPAGGLYVTGKQGAVSRLDESSGAVTTVATTPFEAGGLTFSPDHATLYVGAISNNTLQAFDVRADGSLGPPRLWKSQITRAQALATDECGSVYVVSEGDSRIRRIKASGAVDTITDLAGVYAWSLSFGSGQQGWSAQALYVHEAASGRLYEIPLPYAGQPAPPPGPVE
jgi:sugar lactone lactonase YvrE